MANYRVIGKNGKELDADIVLHPGEVLTEELETREIYQKDFAALLNMRPSHFNELLKGKRHISAILALKLEKYLGIDARFWMRLQADYDLKLARKQIKVA